MLSCWSCRWLGAVVRRIRSRNNPGLCVVNTLKAIWSRHVVFGVDTRDDESECHSAFDTPVCCTGPVLASLRGESIRDDELAAVLRTVHEGLDLPLPDRFGRRRVWQLCDRSEPTLTSAERLPGGVHLRGVRVETAASEEKPMRSMFRLVASRAPGAAAAAASVPGVTNFLHGRFETFYVAFAATRPLYLCAAITAYQAVRRHAVTGLVTVRANGQNCFIRLDTTLLFQRVLWGRRADGDVDIVV
jgi:hypothetical protein